MKRNLNIILINCIIILLIFQITPIKGVQPDWSSTLTVKTYHWYASKSELRNLDTIEQYNEWYLIGGINVPGGGNSVSLMSAPPANFSFFNGSRLDLDVGVEGDIRISLPQFGSDFHLLLLPIKINNRSFFEVLFEEKDLLENLTLSSYLDSAITATTATAFLKYNDILDVQYQWNTTTGLLMRKEVTSPSGLQLIVIPGKGNQIPGWNFPIALITVLIIVWWQTKRKKSNK